MAEEESEEEESADLGASDLGEEVDEGDDDGGEEEEEQKEWHCSGEKVDWVTGGRRNGQVAGCMRRAAGRGRRRSSRVDRDREAKAILI